MMRGEFTDKTVAEDLVLKQKALSAYSAVLSNLTPMPKGNLITLLKSSANFV